MTKARTNADNVSGDISAVTAGTGLSGGGNSGAVTLSADTAVVATTSNTITLSNKTIAATSNTLTGVINNTLTTTTGDMIYASSANTPARLGIGSNGQYLTVSSGIPAWGSVSAIPANGSQRITTTESTTNESTFTDLATVGPVVTITTGTKALVIITCNTTIVTNGSYGIVGCAVTGASTISADINKALKVNYNTNGNAFLSYAYVIDTLTAGSNTFTLKYRGSGGGFTHSFSQRELFVMNLGS